MALSGPVEAQQGMSVAIQCEAAGHPVPTILWFKDGIMLVPTVGIVEQTTFAVGPGPFNSPSEGLFGVVGTLSFQSVLVADSGNYTCSAGNSLPGTETLTAVSSGIPLNVVGEEGTCIVIVNSIVACS